MKTILLFLPLLLLGELLYAQTPWRVTAVDPMLATNHTLTLRITAEADQVLAPSSFVMVYHKSYVVGDTLFVLPYYNALSVGSGFPQKQTVTNDLYLGAYAYNNLFYKHLCVMPYEVLDIDTTNYPPTPHLPNYCFDMKNVVSAKNIAITKDITLYPNPATNTLYIATKETYKQGLIYNNMGQLVQTVNANSKQVDISMLPSGSYYLLLTTNDKTVSRAFTVVH